MSATAMPYVGENMSACCQRTERECVPGARWLQCAECGTVLVNIDGLIAAPAVVEVALFDV
ncbi:hypothetical protein, partial [Humibacter albus]